MEKFLEEDSLQRLTGWKLKSKQIEWLRTNAIPYRINGRGEPVVLWSDIERNHLVKAPEDWNPNVLA